MRATVVAAATESIATAGGERPAETNQTGNLRMSRDSLPELWPDGEVQRLRTKVQLAARGGAEFFGFDGDTPLDFGDSAVQGQPNHRALQLGGRIDIVKRIDRSAELVQRRIHIDLRVYQRRRPDQRDNRPAHRTFPLPRCIAGGADIDPAIGLAAAHLAPGAHRREQRAQVHAFHLRVQRQCGRRLVSGIERQIGDDRATEYRRLQRGDVEASVLKLDLQQQIAQPAAIGERKLANADFALGVDAAQQCDRNRLVADAVRRCCRMRGGDRSCRGACRRQI
jgi:hypothetical protein